MLKASVKSEMIWGVFLLISDISPPKICPGNSNKTSSPWFFSFLNKPKQSKMIISYTLTMLFLYVSFPSWSCVIVEGSGDEVSIIGSSLILIWILSKKVCWMLWKVYHCRIVFCFRTLIKMWITLLQCCICCSVNTRRENLKSAQQPSPLICRLM